LTKTEILIIHTMPMKTFQHIRVTAFREPLRTYERDTKGIEEL
jgi:hypothetical protein